MNLFRALSSVRLFKVLLALNAVMALAVFLVFRSAAGGDARSYLSLADGILHGRYSMWWFLPTDVPDTFRGPGYPLFLVPFRYLTTGILPVQIAQLLLYAGSVLLTLRIIGRLGGGLASRNLFLLILLPSLNMPYFIPGLFPEIPAMMLITAFVWVDVVGKEGWKKAVLLALLAGAAFQLRSSLLLLPPCWALARWIFHRDAARLRTGLVFLCTFGMALLPYGLWNYMHHGVFRPTPLEGGAGVAHMGWWSGKIPGHTEHWYWGNVAGSEMLHFTDPDSVPRNVEAFNAEWGRIDDALRPLLTTTDSTMLDSQQTHPGLFRTYSTAYTTTREHLLWKATMDHVREEPGYTLRYKLYSAIRLWVTGVQVDQFNKASTTGKLVLLYPFLITLSVFLAALFIVPVAFLRHRGLAATCMPLLIWLFYFGVVHIPFAIQARYTVPVRLSLFAVIAISAERSWSKPTPLPRDSPRTS